LNIIHLKYAVEVEKTRSISKAAENLFMGQPNLSRAIKELEESLGIIIFKRTSKGISITPQGEEFLQYAKKILHQIEEVENIYKNGKLEKQIFSISVPRATYISWAFTEFAKNIVPSKQAEIFYKETNSSRTINNILQADYKLGILRYQTTFQQHFDNLLHERGLVSELVTEFSYVAVMSKEHPLAEKKDIELLDFKDYIEIAHGDPYVPSLPMMEARKAELSEFVDKRIFVFERASQMDLLSNVHNTFMWMSPMPKRFLDRYDLVQKQCKENVKVYKDVLIYRKGYTLSELDKMFIRQLDKAKESF